MIRASTSWKQQFQFEGKGNDGIPVEIDGDGKSANSPSNLVLVALCGCTASDVVGILRKKREPFTSIEVRASAERAPEPPTVYTSIKLTYVVGGKVTLKAVEDAVRLSKEKYCSVSAMLQKTVNITSEIELLEG